MVTASIKWTEAHHVQLKPSSSSVRYKYPVPVSPMGLTTLSLFSSVQHPSLLLLDHLVLPLHWVQHTLTSSLSSSPLPLPLSQSSFELPISPSPTSSPFITCSFSHQLTISSLFPPSIAPYPFPQFTITSPLYLEDHYFPPSFSLSLHSSYPRLPPPSFYPQFTTLFLFTLVRPLSPLSSVRLSSLVITLPLNCYIC